MAFVSINPPMELQLKLVYYGPASSGKGSCLRYIHQQLPETQRGKLVSLDEDGAHHLFFGLSLREKVRGYGVRLQLCTLTGPVPYEASRKLLLKKAEGVVFVADSSLERMEANIESLDGLLSNLAELGEHGEKFPVVLQYNKRDAADALPIEEMDQALRLYPWARFESIATSGIGVIEPCKWVSKLAAQRRF